MLGLTEKSGDIMRTVDKLDKIGAEKVARILVDDCGLTEEQAQEILKFIAIRGTNAEILEKLAAYKGRAELFDLGYEELQAVAESMDAVAALTFLNRELFTMIDNRIPLELLARLLSSQLVTRGEKHLLDRDRTYFRLLHRIVRRGQERGELRSDITANEIVKGYAMFERALMYDWCLVGGEYALGRYAADMMPTFLEGYRTRR